VFGVIGQIVAGLGMGEDRQPLPVERRPLREGPEAFRRHRQLAAATRMRPHRPQVKVPDGHPEQPLRLARQLPQAEKARRATFVVHNDGTEKDLERELSEVLDKLGR